VLSTPPAFVLSQDQTLRQRSSRFFDTSTDGGRGEEFALIWTRCPRGHRGSPSSPRRARRGWTAPGSNLAPMCWLIRSPDVPSTVALGQRTPGRARCARPVVTGFRALAFHTLLSFQGASWDRPCDSPGGSPRRSRRRSGGNLTLGLPGSSTERPIPWFFRGYPPFRSFVPFGRCLKRHRLRRSQRLKRRVIPWYSPGNPLPCHRRFTAPTTVSRIPVSLPGTFGATSPPALHTEAPSWALWLRTATAAVGTLSQWLSVTSCLPCWHRAGAAGEV
jgi:hypothetical protein